MTIQILVSTMNQKDYGLVDKMNLFADAIIINQCNKTGRSSFEQNGYRVDWYDCEERGIGKSRNTALQLATADICVFADDDLVYADDARRTVEAAFTSHLDAALIIFNINGGLALVNCVREKRLHSWNAYKYGAARMAVRREKLLKNRVSFSLLFGGGAKYSCGEDSLFISDCIKKGLKLYAVPGFLGKNLEGESTWFKGYNQKFFFDRGVLYAAMNPVLSKIYCIRYVLCHASLFAPEVARRKALGWMLEGTKER